MKAFLWDFGVGVLWVLAIGRLIAANDRVGTPWAPLPEAAALGLVVGVVIHLVRRASKKSTAARESGPQ